MHNANSVAQYAPDTIIVKFKSRVTPDDVAHGRLLNINRLNAKHRVHAVKQMFQKKGRDAKLDALKDKVGLTRIHKLKVPPGTDILQAVADYAADPDVEYAEPDYIAHINQIPNDSYYASTQWNLNNSGAFETGDGLVYGTAHADIDAQRAWDITTGVSSVVIAILDTGVQANHPDLVGKVLAGWDFVNNDNNPDDDHGHGTHVAGIAAANSNNGIGVTGVCWGCSILPVKVADAAGDATLSNIADGIVWAVDYSPNVKVINMSFGDYTYSTETGPIYSKTEYAAIIFANAADRVLVASSGNDDTESTPYPASFSEVIAVGATDNNDNRAIFWSLLLWGKGSNFGSYLDVVAPGEDIFSLNKGSSYKFNSGTSMAAPHVAGLAGLILSVDPNLMPYDVRWYIQNGAQDQVGDPIEDTAGWDKYYGRGRINAYNSVRSVALDTMPAVTSFSVTPNSVVQGDSFTITYCITDKHGLKQVELLRATDTNGDGQADWPDTAIKITLISGQTSYCGSFIDTPQASGTYWYGLHAVDLSGNWNDEQNSKTGGSPGNYGPVKVTVTSGSTCTDSSEPNNSSSQAYGPMNSGSSYSGKICTNTDIDWFKINVTSPGTISLSLSVPSSNDYDLQLYNPSYSWVAESSNGTGVNEAITYSAATTGTYYIRVYSPSSSYNTTSSYTLSYNFATGNAPIVTTSSASSVNSTGATLNGNIDPNGSSTTTWFEWGTNSTLSTYNSTPSSSPFNSQSISQAILSGLSPSTIYYYRVAASNNGGTNRGTIFNFTTSASQTTQTELITNGSFSSGILLWTQQGGDSWAGTNLTNYRTSPGYAALGVDSTGTPKNSADGAFYQTVSIPANATAATFSFWYYISTNETGSTANDNLYVSVRNSSDVFLAYAATLSNVDKTTGYVQKTFDLSSYIGQTIRIRFGATTNSTNTTTFRIDDVSIAVSYSMPSVTTSSASATSTSATLNGSVNPNGSSTNAWFEWGTSSTLSSYTQTHNQSIGSGTTSQAVSVSLSGLNTSTTYYYRVASSNSAGTSRGSILNFTTQAVQIINRTLSVASSDPSSGVSITVSPNDNYGYGNGTTSFIRTYDDKTSATLFAPATASGNNFQKWQRNGLDYSTNSSTSVTMDANYTMTALYVTPSVQYQLTTSVSPSGTGSVSTNCSGGCSYSSGTSVTLTATAISGYTFSSWSGCDSSSGTTCYMTMSSSKAVMANFVDATPPKDGNINTITGSDQVALSWSGFSDNVGVTGYKLLFSSTMPASCNSGTQLYSGPDTTYTHTGLTPGQVYYYYLCAFDAAGNRSNGVKTGAMPGVYNGNPIATAANREVSISSAFDGTNYLVGLQGGESSNHHITAQLVSQSGARVGQRIKVGRTGGTPLVAFDGVNHLLVWADDANFPDNDIYGQFVSRSGALVGVPFVVDSAPDRQDNVWLQFDGTNYFAAWFDKRSGVNYDIYGRFISRSGVLGPEIKINTTALSNMNSVSLAFDNVKHLVVWDAPDTVRARFVDKAGSLSGPEFNIAGKQGTCTTGFTSATAAYDGTRYFVVWTDRPGDCSTDRNIYGQSVTTSGVLSGQKITVSGAPGQQLFPFVAFDGAKFFVAWTDGRTDANRNYVCDSGEGNCYEIYGQYVNASGALQGTEFLITNDEGNQFISPIVYASGKYFLTWTNGDWGDGFAGDVNGKFMPINSPDVIPPTGIISIKNGALSTKITAVTLTLSATDNNVTVSQMRFSSDNVTWSAWENYATTKAWTLSVGDGIKTVYAQFKDAAGNPSIAVSDTIALDLTPPTGTISIKNGALSTKITAVTLTLTAIDNNVTLSKMRFKDDAAVWSAWEDYATTKAWTLTSGEGVKTVYVQFTDVAGNASTAVTDTIILDLIPPTGTISIKNGALFTKVTDVTLSISATDNNLTISKMRFKDDAAVWSAWEDYATIKAWTLTSGEGVKTVYVQFTDVAGNTSTAVNDTIRLDQTPPTGTISINTGAASTKLTAATLTLTATDNNLTISKMRFKDDTTVWSAWENYAPTKAWTLSAGEGVKTVYVQFTDAAGNTSIPVSDTIALDLTLPTGTISIKNGALATKITAVTLNLTATDNNVTISKMRFKDDAAVWSAWEDYATTKSWTLVAGEGVKTVYVQFTDAAGNSSTAVSDTIRLDTTIPTGTISINGGAASTYSTNVTLTLSAADNNGIISQMRFKDDTAVWSAWENYATTKAWTLSAGAGTKTVYVQFADAAGNPSVSSTDTISLVNVASISGRVTTKYGGGIANVVVSINTVPAPTTATTDSNGNYTINNVPAGTYKLTPSVTGVNGSLFSPASENITLGQDNISGISFRGKINYSISGTVNYAGTKTGRIYLGLGEVGTSISAPGAFTFSGVAPGARIVNAYMDHIGDGMQHATSPSSRVDVTVDSSNVTGVSITLTDPAPIVPTQPKILSVSPSNGAAIIEWKFPADSFSAVSADSVNIYYGTSPSVSPVNGTRVGPVYSRGYYKDYLLKGLTNGSTLYFVVVGNAGANTSAPSNVYGPVTIGPRTGGNTVSGTITASGFMPTGSLIVSLSDTAGTRVYSSLINSPAASQPYSITGVPTGSYYLRVLFDMNNNGFFDGGDLTNEAARDDERMVRVSSNQIKNTIINGADIFARILTQTSSSGQVYGRTYFMLQRLRKLPVKVTSVSGPGMAGPFDLPKVSWVGYYGNLEPLDPSVVGDTYTINLTYLDGTTSTITRSVTGFVDNILTALTPSGSVPGSTTPTFIWSASPSVLPSTGAYRIWVRNTSNYDEYWYSAPIPSTAMSVQFNFDGFAVMPSLTPGTVYSWSIEFEDQYGNTSTSNSLSFTP